MPRNLDRRIEAITPIHDPEIAKDLQEILGIMLADNLQAWELQPNGTYLQRHPCHDCPEASSQKALMSMAKKSTANATNLVKSKKSPSYSDS
jgi:polyphosphate kinase